MRHPFTVDWRDAWRSLRATPVVTTIAVLSLALGIGANTALFSILNSLILKSLPVREPQQLVVLDDGSWTNPIWEQVRAHEQELGEGAFAWSATRSTSRRADRPTSSTASGSAGGCSTCSACRRCSAGRSRQPDDVRGGGSDGAVAVISYGFWQRRFGGAADVIGRTISIDARRSRSSASRRRGSSAPMSAVAFDVAIPLGIEPVMRGAERAARRAVDLVAGDHGAAATRTDDRAGNAPGCAASSRRSARRRCHSTGRPKTRRLPEGSVRASCRPPPADRRCEAATSSRSPPSSSSSPSCC